MPRIRSVKPEFFDDEKLARVSRDARLLFIGLLVQSDDYGVVRGNLIWLRSKIFPFEDIELEIFQFWMSELIKIGIIKQFEKNHEQFFFIKNFRIHQKIDKVSSIRNPAPPQEFLVDDDSTIDRLHVDESSTINPRRIGIGKGIRKGIRKGKGEGGEPSPSGDGPTPAFSCESFEVSQEHLAALTAKHPAFPRAYLLEVFLPKMSDWCADHRNDPAHRKKFDADGRLKETRRCLTNWLKLEDPGKADAYRRPKPPPPRPSPDPPGWQRVHDPLCAQCHGGGMSRDGPCLCGKLEEIVYPDQGCPLCGGGGLTKQGPCSCLKPRKYEPGKNETVTAPPGQA